MIEGKAIARFGTGDILVTPLVKEELLRGYIVLQNKGTHVIGEYTKDFKEEEEDTILIFENVESLNVVIERLEKLRDMLCGDLSDCRPPIEFEH